MTGKFFYTKSTCNLILLFTVPDLNVESRVDFSLFFVKHHHLMSTVKEKSPPMGEWVGCWLCENPDFLMGMSISVPNQNVYSSKSLT